LFDVVVIVMDSDLEDTPISVNTTVRVRVLNDNDVAVTSIHVTESSTASGLGSEVGVSAAGSPGRAKYGSSHSSLDSLFATRGGGIVELWGASFGKTARRLSREGSSSSIGQNPTTVTATFGPSGTEFQAIGCLVVEANTRVQCTMPEGYGRDHHWIITINGDQIANSLQNVSSRVLAGSADAGTAERNPETGSLLPLRRLRRSGYFPPVVTTVRSSEGTEDGSEDGTIPTMGSPVSPSTSYRVVVSGTDLGPDPADLSAAAAAAMPAL